VVSALPIAPPLGNVGVISLQSGRVVIVPVYPSTPAAPEWLQADCKVRFGLALTMSNGIHALFVGDRHRPFAGLGTHRRKQRPRLGTEAPGYRLTTISSIERLSSEKVSP